MIPWYLIPRRPYPLQIYQFACSYYSSNPEIGQRGAAEATRVKFDLETFSHSTVGRSFRSFECAQKSALEDRFGKEVEFVGTEALCIVSAAPKGADSDTDAEIVGADTDGCRVFASRIPSAGDTAERRKVIAEFLPKFQKDTKPADIESAGCRFVKKWHEKSRRLLL